MNNFCLQPDIFITVVKNESGYTAFGSRKINFFDLEHKVEYGELLGDRFINVMGIDKVAHTEIRGEVDGITMVQGTTRLAAIGALIDALDTEEREEAAQRLEILRQRELRERFGGEVNEELIRKVVKWRKKKAEKQEYYDAYEENPDGY